MIIILCDVVVGVVVVAALSSSLNSLIAVSCEVVFDRPTCLLFHIRFFYFWRAIEPASNNKQVGSNRKSQATRRSKREKAKRNASCEHACYQY